MPHIRIHRFRSAARFLDAISLRGQRSTHPYSEFLFRGHADSDWSLVPAALRNGARLLDGNGLPLPARRTIREQIMAEWYVISRFIDELNHNGLHLPSEDALALSTNWDHAIDFATQIGRGEILWPPLHLHSLIALAQHNGIPTRFLDWTYSPSVAAYFACREYFDHPERRRKGGSIAVFALDASAYEFRAFSFMKYEPYQERRTHTRRFQLVKSPAYFNDNLKAQRGVFLAYVEAHFYANDECSPVSLEKFVSTMTDEFPTGTPVLQKFVLPSTECPELLRLLALDFVDAGSLFPGVAGAARAVHEKLAWSTHLDLEEV